MSRSTFERKKNSSRHVIRWKYLKMEMAHWDEEEDYIMRPCHMRLDFPQYYLGNINSQFWWSERVTAMSYTMVSNVKGRQTVRGVISPCATCKKLEGKSYNAPPQSPLPEFRVSDELAFTQVGVDFAGPVYLKDVYSRSNKVYKAYIAIFTCSSSRAVHLELVPDLSTETFLRCLKRQERGCHALSSRIMGRPSKVQVWKFSSVSMALLGSSMSLVPLGGVGFLNGWCAPWNAASRKPLEMHKSLMKSSNQYLLKSKEYLTLDPWLTSMKTLKNHSHLPPYPLDEDYSVPFQSPKAPLHTLQSQSCLEGRSIFN